MSTDRRRSLTGFSLMLDGLSPRRFAARARVGPGPPSPARLRRVRSAPVGRGRARLTPARCDRGDDAWATPSTATELETDDQGYLLEPDFSDEVVRVIAAAEDIELTDAHWKVVAYLRDEYREHGHTPNFRNMLKGLAEVLPGCDSKALYDLFPTGPAKQGAKVAGLPQPLGKGGY